MNSLREAIASAALYGLFGSLFFFTPLWAPRFVFRNLTPLPARRDERAHPSFTVSDGLVLIALLAVGNSLVALLRSEMPMALTITIAIGVNALIGLMWIQCQRFMRKCRIQHWGRRMIMQAVLYPLSVLVVAEILTCGMMLLSALEFFENGFESGVRKYVQHPLVVTAASLLVLSIVTVLVLRWLFKRYVVPPETEGE